MQLFLRKKLKLLNIPYLWDRNSFNKTEQSKTVEVREGSPQNTLGIGVIPHMLCERKGQDMQSSVVLSWQMCKDHSCGKLSHRKEESRRLPFVLKSIGLNL